MSELHRRPHRSPVDQIEDGQDRHVRHARPEQIAHREVGSIGQHGADIGEQLGHRGRTSQQQRADEGPTQPGAFGDLVSRRRQGDRRPDEENSAAGEHQEPLPRRKLRDHGRRRLTGTRKPVPSTRYPVPRLNTPEAVRGSTRDVARLRISPIVGVVREGGSAGLPRTLAERLCRSANGKRATEGRSITSRAPHRRGGEQLDRQPTAAGRSIKMAISGRRGTPSPPPGPVAVPQPSRFPPPGSPTRRDRRPRRRRR